MNRDGRKVERLRRRDPRELGGYQLVGRLGAGGMGVVFLGQDRAGHRVAVKMVHAELAQEAEFRGRFRSEVARASQIPSFCTAEVLGADPDHDPPYLVAEYVDGPALDDAVDKHGPLNAENLHALALGVASALAAIHDAGVIHRDLKPGNVLLGPGGPKVIDFGIARAFEATSQFTRTDQMVGTVAYMAPERFGDGKVGPAADVFAWGAVVAYGGLGHAPFPGRSPAVMATRILTDDPELDGLPSPLRELVGGALAKKPADRPTARELVILLVDVSRRQAPTALVEAGHGTDGHGADGRGPAAHRPVSSAADRAVPPRPAPPRPAPSRSGSDRSGPDRSGAGRSGSGRFVADGSAAARSSSAAPADALPASRLVASRMGRRSRFGSPRADTSVLRLGSGNRSIAAQVVALGLLIVGLGLGGVALVFAQNERNADASTASPNARASALLNGRSAATRVTPKSAVAPRSSVRSDLNAKCVDVVETEPADGQPLLMRPCRQAPNQTWQFAADGTLRSSGKCLDVADASKSDGARVQLVTCNGSSAQQWRYTDGRDVVNVQADRCLDIDDGDPESSAPLQMRRCNGQANQKWVLPA